MISYHPVSKKTEAKPIFSILIPTWNNLDLLKLCVESILKNSRHAHQLILHINQGNDGSLEYAQQMGLDYTYSAQNVGICLACNAAANLAITDYILYINDDMYACPDWDKYLYDAILEYGKNDFYFSATMIERLDAGANFVVCPHHFGTNPADFKERELLDTLPNLAIPDWQGANYPPSVMHRHTWGLIGGFSIEFSPGMYSDPDICRKLWQVGVRNFRGIGQSLVYHFMSKSVGRIKRNNGKKQFLLKWGITSRVFFKYFTLLHEGRRDATYKGILPEPIETFPLKFERWIAKVKKHF